MERRQPRIMWVWSFVLAGLVTGVMPVSAEMQMPTPVPETGWREPLDRAEAALAQGEARRAEQAWEEAQRAAMRPTIPPSGLINVGLAYLKIGEAVHDRPTAVARTRQLLLRALFRARRTRDVESLTAVSHAFASLGDCEIAERAFDAARVMAHTPPARPTCDRPDATRQPSASPRSGTQSPAGQAR